MVLKLWLDLPSFHTSYIGCCFVSLTICWSYHLDSAVLPGIVLHSKATLLHDIFMSVSHIELFMVPASFTPVLVYKEEKP